MEEFFRMKSGRIGGRVMADVFTWMDEFGPENHRRS
jgi:hypothetical protein